MRRKHVIIIGSGFGGLSAASILGKQGFRVTILEKNKDLGGRARVWKKNGFTFDMGPSWYLGPEIFDNFFSQLKQKTTDFYKLKRLDPSYRIFFAKDDLVDIPPDLKKLYTLFDTFENQGGEKLRKYLDISKAQYEISMKSFIYKSYNSIFSIFNKQMFREGKKLPVFESMEKFVSKFFTSDRAKKILQYNLVFLGGAPKNTPALYSLMAHMDFNLGVWYPEGGFGSVVNGFASLAKFFGANIKTNIEVKKIIIKNGKAVGVKTSKGDILADLILANADYHHVETSLLPKPYQSYSENYWKKKTIAPSAFIIFLGLNKKIKNLSHHNLFLDHNWQDHFNSIFENPHWHENPSYYVSCPSKTDPTVAPAGKENLFILVPTAPGLKDNEKTRREYAKRVLNHLEGLIGESIQDNIEVMRIFAQSDFTRDYHAYKGTALGLSQTLFQTAVFRPKHQSSKVKNLYFTGQFTHPGIGVPMVIISSQIVTQEIIKKYGNS
jgi:phytoene desaturase